MNNGWEIPRWMTNSEIIKTILQINLYNILQFLYFFIISNKNRLPNFNHHKNQKTRLYQMA